MLDLMKIVGLSAVLSAGFVTASEMQGSPASEPANGKIYTDRVPQGEAVPAGASRVAYAARSDERPQISVGVKGDLLRGAPQPSCASQAWPHIAPQCLVQADGTPPRSIRMITVEHREGANTSVLVRVPASEVAQR